MIDDPFCYPPNYEKLTGDLTGLYSKRINFINKLFMGGEYGDYFLVKDGSKRKSYVAM